MHPERTLNRIPLQAEERYFVSGEHGVLNAWQDGSFHKTTNEPTFCVDVIYIDRFSGKQQRKRQRGLRVSAVASICACICLGEEALKPEFVNEINLKFSI